MTKYVALFRGINVGGNNMLPMQELRELLALLGCEDVQTHIQSGNAVFSSAENAQELSGKVRDAIEAQFGFAPQVVLLSQEALYLHAPDGIGRSRLAAKVDRLLGVSTTARNWRTVMKLLDLAE